MRIGSIFWNVSEKGDEYGSVVLDDVIKSLHRVFRENRISIKEIPADKRSENSPMFEISMYKPQERQ